MLLEEVRDIPTNPGCQVQDLMSSCGLFFSVQYSEDTHGGPKPKLLAARSNHGPVRSHVVYFASTCLRVVIISQEKRKCPCANVILPSWGKGLSGQLRGGKNK